MLIYNKQWLLNLEIQNLLKKALRNGDINPEELKKAEEKYPVGFYSPNIFVRAGLFLLTLIVISFSFGILVLMTESLKIFESGIGILVIGIIIYLILEQVVRELNHYRSGVDDALMWVSAGLILYACIIFLDNTLSAMHHSELIISVCVLILSSYYTLRFSDLLMTAVAFLSLVAVIFFGWQTIGLYSLQTMPFLIIALAYIGYLKIKSLDKKKETRFYVNCILIIKVLSLLLGYIAGNYFIVRELQAMLTLADPGSTLPFAWFFWAWTILVPFAYIAIGIMKKNVILLRSGLILVAAAAFTFRNYYHLMPTESALCIAGALLLVIAYSVTQYLKTPKHGFTADEIDDDQLLDKIKVESLIVGETFSGNSTPEATRFGGGDFGGGGASGSF